MNRVMGAGLLLAGLCLAPLTAWAGDAKLLPPNAEVVFSVNVKQILGSEVVKGQKEFFRQLKTGLQSKIPGDDQAQKYLEKLGLDPLKDVESVTVAHPGTQNDLDSLFVIVEGKFDTEKFESTAEEAAKDNGDALKISKVGKIKIYEVAPPGEKHFFISLLSEKALIVTPSQELLNEALARYAGTKKSGLKKEMRDLLKDTSDKQSLSLVFTGAALARQAENLKVKGAELPPNVGPALQAIDAISLAVTIAKNINFELAIGSKDAAAAKNFVATGNAGLLGLRILVAGEAKKNEQLAPLVDVMNSLRVSARGTTTVLTGEVSYGNLEKLIKNFNKLPQQ